MCWSCGVSVVNKPNPASDRKRGVSSSCVLLSLRSDVWSQCRFCCEGFAVTDVSFEQVELCKRLISFVHVKKRLTGLQLFSVTSRLLETLLSEEEVSRSVNQISVFK